MEASVTVIYFLCLELFVELELSVMDFKINFMLKHKSELGIEYGSQCEYSTEAAPS